MKQGKFFKRLLKEPADPGGQGGGDDAGSVRSGRQAKGSRKAGAGMLLAAAAVGTPAAVDGVAAASMAASSAAPGSGDVVEETYVYKTTDRGALHVTVVKPAGPVPAGGRPCMLFFHGGGWRRGSSHQFVPFSTLLARHGVVGMSAEYRLLQPDEDAVPIDAIEDARSAARWVRENAAQFGCDLRRIGAGGGSAGGHLAMMTAMKVHVDDPKDDLRVDPRPAALVVFNAPFNLDDYASRVPVAERRKYAPYYLVDDTLPPTMIMQGTEDRTVSYDQAVKFRDKAKAVGVKDIALIPFEGSKHGFFNRGKGRPADVDASAGNMLGFFRRLGWIS